MKGKMIKKNERGFTLVEMVVVIAIIGVLAAILIPSVLNYVRKAQRRVDTANAKQIWTTVQGLLADQDFHHTLDQSDKYAGRINEKCTNEMSFYAKASGNPAFNNVEVFSGGSRIPEKYKLQVVAKITGKPVARGGKKRLEWVTGCDEHRVFVESLNKATVGKDGGDSFVGDSDTLPWPMKYVSHKGGYETDQWLICYRDGDHRVEIWTGNSSKAGNSGPMYRVWPDPCDDYSNEHYNSDYQRPNETFSWCGTIGTYKLKK